MSRYYLSPLCDTLCNTFVPKSVHPDILTVFGVISASLSAFFAINGLWVPCGIFWMFYCLMDNMDGKQARRTGKSSPGGEFLDHSCDAVVTTLSIVVWESALCGPLLSHLRKHYQIWGGQGPYFTSTWAHAFLGRLVLGSSFDGSVDMITVDEYNFFLIPGIAFIRGLAPFVLDYDLSQTILSSLPESLSRVFTSAFLSSPHNTNGVFTVGMLIVMIMTLISFYTLAVMMIALVRPKNLKSFLPLPIFYALVIFFDFNQWMVLGFFATLIMEQIAFRMHLHDSLRKLYEPLVGLCFLGFFKIRSENNSLVLNTVTLCYVASWAYATLTAFAYRNGLNAGKTVGTEKGKSE